MIKLAVVIAALVSQAPGDTAKKELERHQGTWSVVAFVRDGKETPKDLVSSIVRIVEGDHVVWKREGKAFAGTTIVLDPTTTPATIDVIPDGGKNRGEKVAGIYKFVGEQLVICMADAGQDRPKAFDAPAGVKQTLMTFRKQVSPARP